LDDRVIDSVNGLPEAARQRVETQAASGVRSSLFSAPAAAAAQSAGLAPVGEVFGCVVMNLGWSGGGCGWYGTSTGGLLSSFTAAPTSPVLTSGRGGRYAGMAPYVKAIETGWHGALQRLLAEAKALGADGVVGIRMERSRLQNQVWEFTALGTAVRSTDPIVAPRPANGGLWRTDLSAEDAASAILSGFMPSEVVMGLSVSTKHEDWALRSQRTSWVNQEVDGMTELIRAARDEARQQLSSRATHRGGAHLVVTQMDLQEFETACGGGQEDSKDFHAEALFVGTTLVPIPAFHASRLPRTLTVLSLRDTR
jgi:uncharacterized protein YbjQ (UPF0145 family)